MTSMLGTCVATGTDTSRRAAGRSRPDVVVLAGQCCEAENAATVKEGNAQSCVSLSLLDQDVARSSRRAHCDHTVPTPHHTRTEAEEKARKSAPAACRMTNSCADCVAAAMTSPSALTEEGFSLHRFAPFYELAIREVILESERRMVAASAAAREAQTRHLRGTHNRTLAASTYSFDSPPASVLTSHTSVTCGTATTAAPSPSLAAVGASTTPPHANNLCDAHRRPSSSQGSCPRRASWTFSEELCLDCPPLPDPVAAAKRSCPNVEPFGEGEYNTGLCHTSVGTQRRIRRTHLDDIAAACTRSGNDRKSAVLGDPARHCRDLCGGSSVYADDQDRDGGGDGDGGDDCADEGKGSAVGAHAHAARPSFLPHTAEAAACSACDAGAARSLGEEEEEEEEGARVDGVPGRTIYSCKSSAVMMDATASNCSSSSTSHVRPLFPISLSVPELLRSLSACLRFGNNASMIFIAGLAYLARVAVQCASEYACVTWSNWYKLTTTTILVASKVYNEYGSRRLNAQFARAATMTLAEMNRCELDFLYLVDFDLLLEEREVQAWLRWMRTLAMRHDMLSTLSVLVPWSTASSAGRGGRGSRHRTNQESHTRGCRSECDSDTSTAAPTSSQSRSPTTLWLSSTVAGGSSVATGSTTHTATLPPGPSSAAAGSPSVLSGSSASGPHCPVVHAASTTASSPTAAAAAAAAVARQRSSWLDEHDDAHGGPHGCELLSSPAWEKEREETRRGAPSPQANGPSSSTGEHEASHSRPATTAASTHAALAACAESPGSLPTRTGSAWAWPSTAPMWGAVRCRHHDRRVFSVLRGRSNPPSSSSSPRRLGAMGDGWWGGLVEGRTAGAAQERTSPLIFFRRERSAWLAQTNLPPPPSSSLFADGGCAKHTTHHHTSPRRGNTLHTSDGRALDHRNHRNRGGQDRGCSGSDPPGLREPARTPYASDGVVVVVAADSARTLPAHPTRMDGHSRAPWPRSSSSSSSSSSTACDDDAAGQAAQHAPEQPYANNAAVATSSTSKTPWRGRWNVSQWSRLGAVRRMRDVFDVTASLMRGQLDVFGEDRRNRARASDRNSTNTVRIGSRNQNHRGNSPMTDRSAGTKADTRSSRKCRDTCTSSAIVAAMTANPVKPGNKESAGEMDALRGAHGKHRTVVDESARSKGRLLRPCQNSRRHSSSFSSSSSSTTTTTSSSSSSSTPTAQSVHMTYATTHNDDPVSAHSATTRRSASSKATLSAEAAVAASACTEHTDQSQTKQQVGQDSHVSPFYSDGRLHVQQHPGHVEQPKQSPLQRQAQQTMTRARVHAKGRRGSRVLTPQIHTTPSSPLSPAAEEEEEEEEEPDEDSVTVSAPEEMHEDDEGEEGYFDEEGNYFYYDEEDVGYYDKEGAFHYYDDYEEEDQEEDENDEDEDEGEDAVYYSSSPSCREDDEQDSHRRQAVQPRRSSQGVALGMHELQDKSCVGETDAARQRKHCGGGGGAESAAQRVVPRDNGVQGGENDAVAGQACGGVTTQPFANASLLRPGRFDLDEEDDDVYRDTPPRRLMLTHSPPSL